MSKPLVSVCLATYQRCHLLRRSLAAYSRQEFDNSLLEIVVIDDGSTDGTDELVRVWSKSTGIKTVYLNPLPKEGSWRDCGAILNHGIRASSGEHILLTHPEVIPGRRSVAACMEKLVEFESGRYPHEDMLGGTGTQFPVGTYASCKCYYLSPRDQERLDTVPWLEDGNLAVRQVQGFYEEDENGNPDYRHNVTDLVATPGYRIKTWDSWVFGGCSRETWKRLGGMLVTQRWGSVDILFNHRRKALGMAEWTCPDDESIVIHQNHDAPDDVKTPRDEKAWIEECKRIDHSPEKLCYPGCDELGWGG